MRFPGTWPRTTRVLETALAVVVTVCVFIYWFAWCSWRETPPEDPE